MSLFYLAIFSLLTFSEHFAKIIFTGYFSEYTMLKAEEDGKQLPTKPGGGMPPQGGIFGAVQAISKSCPRLRGKCRGIAVTKGERLGDAKLF